MTGTTLALTSAFLFLSPLEPGPFTPMPGAERPALAAAFAAGGRPLVFTDDAVFTLTNQADVVSAAVFRVLPTRNLLHTWRGLGTKVLAGVSYDAEGTAEYFRRSCAFLPIFQGAEGVWIRDPEALPPSWRAALDEARKDAAVVDYLRELARQALARKDPALRIEARRVAWWLGYMGADWEDLDCLRLECVAYARRLEQLLGLPARDLPTEIVAVPESDLKPARPFRGTAERPRQVSVSSLFGTRDVPLDDAGLFTFSSDRSGVSFSFACTEATPMASTFPGGTYPVGSGTFTLSLYLPSRTGAGFEPYHLEIDPWAFWVGPRVETPARNLFLYSLEERFTPYATGYERPQIRIHCRPQLRTFSPDHPDLSPRLAVTTRPDGGWTAKVTIPWHAMRCFWPSVRNGKIDVWHVGLDRLPNGDVPPPAMISWPRGVESNLPKIVSSIDLRAFTVRYKEELARTADTWMASFHERLYDAPKTERPTYHRFDLESDEAFRVRFVDPLVKANENGWELMQSDRDHHNPRLPGSPDHVKALIGKNLDRYLYLSSAVGAARRDYLRDRFAGKPLGDPPKPDAGKGSAAMPGVGEFVDEGAVPGLDLDDVEY